jgi:hypothetical protein
MVKRGKAGLYVEAMRCAPSKRLTAKANLSTCIDEISNRFGDYSTTVQSVAGRLVVGSLLDQLVSERKHGWRRARWRTAFHHRSMCAVT